MWLARNGRRSLLLSAVLVACAVAAAPAAPAAATPAAVPSGVLFDDFHYRDAGDPALAVHGWDVRTGAGGPGVAGTWSADAVSFPADDSARGGQAMRLRAGTDGTVGGTTQAQVNTVRSKFYSGTFAARVFLTDAPVSGADVDRPVQAFYAISPAADAHYSELDHEYLPNGGWGTTGPRHFTTAWHDPDPAVEDRVSTNQAGSLAGAWHTLVMTVENGTADFFVDDRKLLSTGSPYSPREPMMINFNEWFAESVAGAGATRSWDMKVNWVYYNRAGAQSPAQVAAAVDGYYASGTDFVDTVAAGTVAHDYNGDGISDISLLYDYGATQAAGCPVSPSRDTAMFDLSGRADRSGGLTGLATQWRGPCQPVLPRFTTSGDFTGDGRSDVAAFYDYGSAGTSCPGVDRVAVLVWPADPAGTGALLEPVTAWASSCFGSRTAFFEPGDFNGDGKSDLALLYDHGAGNLRMLTLSAKADGSGTFDGAVVRWEATDWGTGVKFVTAGDLNGDGKSDLALFYDYGTAGATCGGNSHQAVFVMTADGAGSGALSTPMKGWESTCFGGGTSSVKAGDFNGDGRSDLGLLYDYGAGHVKLLTIASGPGGLQGLAARWESTRWGTGTKFVTTGDYNGDGKSDVALLYDCGTAGATCTGAAHQIVYVLTADGYGTGGFPEVAKRWESTSFGAGTRFVS
ncbi:Integrin alpha-8 [Actinoplanes sp. SE50]|nr:Integrin alpha-8 [Actinoplanes sp. SE50/110]ATO86518.1 Integrin alpha-8 [Actinoplanes sp. SE50]SLM03935.1 putative hydrolase [Actinoplanes sp. SE50/110]